MLTKSDIEQIRGVVREEVEMVVEEQIDPLKKDVKILKKSVKKIEKTLDVAIKAFDEEDVKMAKRITKIEQHLNFPS